MEEVTEEQAALLSVPYEAQAQETKTTTTQTTATPAQVCKERP
jgi:hypothetical protein